MNKITKGGIKTFENYARENLNKDLLEKCSLILAGSNKKIGTGSLLVHRIDGVYYQKFTNIKIVNSLINKLSFNKKIINNYNKSDGIIFQSEFSKETFTKFCSKVNKPYVIIKNSADTNIFSPNNNFYSKDLNRKIELVSISLDYPIKRLNVLIAFFKYIGGNKNFNLTIITDKPSIPHQILNRNKSIFNIDMPPGINLKVGLSQLQVASELKMKDIYITFSNRDPCPNSVIEALCTGLPVIGPNFGGVAELIPPEHQFQTNISKVDYFNWFEWSNIDENELNSAKKLLFKILDNYTNERNKIISWSHQYRLSRMIYEYELFIRSLL